MSKLLKTTNRWIAKSKLHWYDFNRLHLWSKQAKLRAAWAIPLGIGIIFPIRFLFALVMTIAETAENLLEQLVLRYVQLIPNPEVEKEQAIQARRDYIEHLKNCYINDKS